MFKKFQNILKCKDIQPLETYTEYNLTESLDKTLHLDVLPSDMIVGKDVMNDLEIFHPYDNETFQSTVYHIFQSNCSTEGGKTFVKRLLQNPISNIHHLENRKKCFQTLANIDMKEYTDLKSKLKETEKDFLWFFSQKEKTVDELINSIYFSYSILNSLNNNSSFMTSYNFYKIILSPMIGVISPIIYFILPFIILKIKFGKLFQMSFVTYVKMLYKSMTVSNNLINLLDDNNGNSMLSRLQMITYMLSLIFYFQGMFNTVSVSRTTYKIVEYISVKVNNAFIYLKACSEINEKVWNNDVHPYENDFITNDIHKVDDELIGMLSEYKPFNEFTIFSHFGDQLVKYKKLNASNILNIVNKTYLIDGLFAITCVKHAYGLSLVDFIDNDSDTPFVTCKKAWHLCVNKDISVKNDIDFKNAIITGPNAGGKSTLIKTVCLNVLLSQTVTLSASEHTKMTPFYFINTQINIPDCKGIESLFEAEMNRCLYTLSVIKNNPNKKCLIVMDEIFNSTNLVEAIAGAYSILQKLNDFDNVMTIITTHFVYLTKLRKHTSFKCHKMNVICSHPDEGKIVFPYILSKGVSKQYVALELLKERGFDECILNNALQIKQKITK